MQTNYLSALPRRFLTVFMMLAILSGCAVSPEFRAKSEPQAVQFAPKQGVLMVKAGSNRNIGTFFGKWQSLRVKNVDTGETFEVVDRSAPYALHSLHIGQLPEGTYDLVRFSSAAHGAISITSSAELGERLGRFAVKDGQVTDLGTILYLRPYFPIDTRLYKLAFASVKTESEKIIDLLDPAVAESARRGTDFWLPLAGLASRPVLNPAREQRSLFLNDPRMSNDGTLLFGEALGQIAQRDRSGSWTWMDTGTVNTILSVFVRPDGTILAGSEQSLLLAKRPNSSSWTPISFPLKDAAIRFIGAHSKLGQLVVAQDRRNIVVLATQDLLNPTWSELKRIPVDLYLNPMMDTRFHAFMANNRLVVVTVSTAFTVKAEMHDLDIDKNQWSSKPIDIYTGGPDVFAATNDGTLFTMGGPNISQSFYVSRDFGVTWEKRASPNWSGVPVFRNNEEGYTIRVDNIPMFDAEKLTNSLWKTVDGGKNWTNIGNVPNQSYRLIMLPSPGHMLLATRNGKLYVTNDSGATWQLERSIQ